MAASHSHFVGFALTTVAIQCGGLDGNASENMQDFVKKYAATRDEKAKEKAAEARKALLDNMISKLKGVPSSKSVSCSSDNSLFLLRISFSSRYYRS